MPFSFVIFCLALIGIVLHFGVKYWEIEHGPILEIELHKTADREALRIKELMHAAGIDLKKVPPLAVHAAQSALHTGAVRFEKFAHWLGKQAHNVADTVSHRRTFTHRETRSEFLKKVSEHKNGGTNSEDSGMTV